MLYHSANIRILTYICNLLRLAHRLTMTPPMIGVNGKVERVGPTPDHGGNPALWNTIADRDTERVFMELWIKIGTFLLNY